MNITIQTMIPPRGAIDYSAEKVGKLRYLCVGAIYPEQVIDVVHSQRTGFVHVTGLDRDLDIQALKEKLETRWEDTETKEMVEKREWTMDQSVFTSKELDTLITDRQITIDATRFWASLRRQLTPETVREEDYIKTII